MQKAIAPAAARPSVSLPETVLDTHALASFLGNSPATLMRWRKEGVGPRFVACSPRAIRYRMSDVLAWCDERSRLSNATQIKT